MRKAPQRNHLGTGSSDSPPLHRIVWVAVLAAVCAASLAACGSTSTSTGSSSEGGGSTASSREKPDLRIGVAGDPLPDPAKATLTGSYSATVFSLAYAPIFHMAPEGEIEPALATSWEYVNEPGKKPNTVFEFDLRKDAKFSNGEPVTAKGVAEWLVYFSKSSGAFSKVLGDSPKATAVDADTVRVELSAPNGQLPELLSDGGQNVGFVLGPKGMKNASILAKETNGAGPYMLDSEGSVRGDHYVYVPNPHYYDPDAIQFSRVEVKVISEAPVRLQAQLADQLDVAEGDSSTMPAAESSGLNIVNAPYVVAYLSLDLTHDLAPELEDKRVREALNLAIDRETIANALFEGHGIPTSAYLKTDVNQNLADFWPYDPEKAKELLAEAGYEDGFSLLTYVPGAFGGTTGEPLTRAVAKNLAEVGVTLEVTPFANDAEYSEKVFAFEAPVTHLLQGIWNTTAIHGTYLAPGAPVNFFGTDKVMERFYREGTESSDSEPAFKKMWEHFTEQAYVIPLMAKGNAYYYSDGIQGVEASEARSSVLPPEWSAG
jgi:peptide/nickel transport system substrate-binding protein